MRTLRGISLKLFSANLLIIVTSIISIIIATILVVTMVLYSLNAKETMEQSFRDLYGDADLSVGYDAGETKTLTRTLIQKIDSQNGIEDVAEVAISHLMTDKESLELYTIGVTNNDITKSRFKFKQDLDESSVILNEGLASSFDYKVDDILSIEGKSYRIIEIIDDIKGTSKMPDILIMHQDNVKPFLRSGEEATYVMIKGGEDQNSLEIVNNIKQIDNGFRIDVFEQDPLVTSNIETLNVFIVILSALILAVTSLLVISNFDVILYKLRNQIAILRSIGATTKQISSIIFFQSFVINTFGVGLGTIFAMLGVQKIFYFAEEALNLPPSTDKVNIILVILIALICFIVFQLFMLIPAFRSTKILPLKIIEENEKQDFILDRTRLTKVLSAIAGTLLFIGYILYHKSDFFIFFILIGISLFLISLIFLLPKIITSCIKIMLPIIGKIFGSESFIALNNLIPQVRKNTLAIISISTLMIIAIFGSTALNTVQKNSETFLLSQYETPIVIENRLLDSSTLNPVEVSADVEKVSGVEGTYFYNGLDMMYYLDGNKEIRVDVAATNGEIVTNIAKDFLVISEKFAKRHALEKGDTISIGADTEDLTAIQQLGEYQIAVISNQLDDDTDIIIGWKNSLNRYNTFSHLYIKTHDEVKTLEELELLSRKYPELKINAFSAAQEESFNMFLQRWAIFIIVLTVLVTSTIVGVFQSLINSIFSRRKEYAVLRGMGVTPFGIKKIILTQILLYVIIGLIIGVFIGIGLSLLIVLIDPTPVIFNYKIIGSISIMILLSSVILFTIVGSRLTKKSVMNEMNFDGK